MKPNRVESATTSPKIIAQEGNLMPRITLAHIALAAVVAFLPATLPAQDKVAVQQVAIENESTQLIDTIEDAARSVHRDLDTLNGNRNLSRHTNNHHLTRVKHSINNGIKPALDRLMEIKPQLPIWKQATVDGILISARSLAMDTNSAIKSLNDKPSAPVVLNVEYRSFLNTMNEHAEKLVDVTHAAGDYADALGQALEAGLEVPAHS
jgi:hypothetical protein